MLDSLRPLGLVLFDPRDAMRDAAERSAPGLVAWTVLLAVAALGAATLPRQLSLLAAALASTGDPAADAYHDALRNGLIRLIVVDRLIPPPTVLLALCILGVLAEPVVALPQSRRKAVWAVLAIGLAPLLAQRIGELAVTYLSGAPGRLTAGLPVSLPQRFETGPDLLWSGRGVPPEWLELLGARANLITLWCLVLWAMGLRQLTGTRLAAWHVVLPAVCLAVAGVITWQLGPPVIALLLGRP